MSRLIRELGVADALINRVWQERIDTGCNALATARTGPRSAVANPTGMGGRND